jgi:hypothetical protein
VSRARSAQRAEFLAGIVTTALEGGIGYWSAAEGYRWFAPDLAGGTAEPGPGGTANAWAVIVPEEGCDGDHWPTLPDGSRGFRVDLDAVELGLRRIAAGGVRGLSDTGSTRRLVMVCDRFDGRDVDGAQYWTGDLDSDAADVIVQVAVFGEVIYG